MAPPSASSRPESDEDARRLFAEFLSARDEDAQLEFEAWVRDHPDHADELRELHGAWAHALVGLPSTPTSGPAPSGGSSLAASLDRGLEVLEELGGGSFGTVHRAWDPVLQREVALKVLDEGAGLTPEARRRFLEEARLLARIDHPNVVRIHSVDAEEGEIRLVLELVKGRTLGAVLERDGPLGCDEAARIGAELCKALAAIHAEGLLHLDVKPGNVMRAAGGRIVLLDFGLARSRTERRDPDARLAGTPVTMAPEQFAGAADIDARADLYAVGAVLFWLVAGRYPHQAETFGELRQKVMESEPSRLLDVRADVPPAFAAVVERALQRDPGARFRSAGEMEAALRGLLGGEVGETRERRPLRGATWALAAVAALAVALVGLYKGGAFASDRFEMEAQFFARRGGTDVRLGSGDSVTTGDSLFLEVEGDRAFHLYVFNEDEAGNLFQLFPLEELGQVNPLSGEAVQRLPRPIDGTTQYWEVSQAGGGAEHMLVLASVTPSVLGQTLCDEIPDATAGEAGVHYPAVRTALRSGLRGVSKLVGSDGVDGVDQVERLSELFLRLKAGISGDEGARLAHFELRHPE